MSLQVLVTSVYPVGKLKIDTRQFPDWEWVIFYKIKKIKRLGGGVHGYAAQLTSKVDVEIVKKDHSRMETNKVLGFKPFILQVLMKINLNYLSV